VRLGIFFFFQSEFVDSLIRMPIGKNLSKIQRKVEKSGKDAALHPRSLKLKQLNRATLRKERLAKQKATRQSLREVEGEWD
jgi:hypothetical protein